MALQFKNVNEEEGVYELLVHGEIGKDFSGADVSNMIQYLNACGARRIKERINSIGGSVADAYGIVSAHISSTAIIETVNEGIADSCAFWIMVTGNQGSRMAMDFSSSLVHNPSVGGVSLENMPDGKTKDEMIIIRDSIAKIVANNTGQTEEFIKQLMQDSKRLPASKLREYGFVDTIIESKNKPLITENMSALDIMNVCKEKVTNINPKKMSLVNQFLNLNSDANENSQVSEIKRREEGLKADILKAENKAKDAAQEVVQLKADLQKAQDEKKAAETKLTAIENASIEGVVNSAIECGKFAESEKENLIAKAKNMGLDNFNYMVSAMVTPAVDVAGKIVNMNPSVNGNEKEMADEYEKAYKSGTLETLKNANPTKFESYETAWTKHYC